MRVYHVNSFNNHIVLSYNIHIPIIKSLTFLFNEPYYQYDKLQNVNLIMGGQMSLFSII